MDVVLPITSILPRYVFCEGYWDYQVESRGVLFAPVYFEPVVYSRRTTATRRSSRSTCPCSSTISSCAQLSHYYFGDYYEPATTTRDLRIVHVQLQQLRLRPIHVNERYRHRDDRDWIIKSGRPSCTGASTKKRDRADAGRPGRSQHGEEGQALREVLAVAAPLSELPRAGSIRSSFSRRQGRESRIREERTDVEAFRGERRIWNPRTHRAGISQAILVDGQA